MIIKDTGVKTCSGTDAELIIPPHQDLDVYPGWLRQRALERVPDYKDLGPNSDAAALSELIHEMDAWDWLDHWGTAIYGGDEFLVSEPYHMNRERIDELLRFCDALNLAVNIQSSGHHYPTKTMRIYVWPKEWPVGDEFLQEEEGYENRAESPSARDCLGQSAESSRPRAPGRAVTPSEADEGDRESGFALEEHLREYLAGNLPLLEDGMTLWPVGKDQNAVEFPVGGSRRRIDILAKDRSGVPTVIELKVSRGHEKTIGQVLYYRARVRELFKVERVRIAIVAREISHELRAAASELQEVSLFEYRLSMTLTRV